jgi:hypothetical protein
VAQYKSGRDKVKPERGFSKGTIPFFIEPNGVSGKNYSHLFIKKFEVSTK